MSNLATMFRGFSRKPKPGRSQARRFRQASPSPVESLEPRIALATIGSDLTIVNETPYKFVQVSTTGYSGDSPYEIDWNMAQSIPSGGTATTRQEWENNFWNHTDANAKTVYKLAGTPYKFAVVALYATVDGEHERTYGLRAINLPGDPADGTEILQPTHDNGQNSIVIAGRAKHFRYGNDQSDWMQATLPSIGGRTLRQVSIPGSHDAGMSEVVGGTFGVANGNVQTQTADIAGQLRYGSRYFDIRPVIAGGEFRAGHYTDNDTLGTAGANGQTIASMVSQINDFTAQHHELVILNLSHDFDTDSGTKFYPSLSQGQYDQLLQLLSGIHDLYVAPKSAGTDLTKVKLDKFIGGDKAAVIVIAQPAGRGSDRSAITPTAASSRGASSRSTTATPIPTTSAPWCRTSSARWTSRARRRTISCCPGR